MSSPKKTTSELVAYLRKTPEFTAEGSGAFEAREMWAQAADRLEALEKLCTELHSDLYYQRTGLHENIELAEKIRKVLGDA